MTGLSQTRVLQIVQDDQGFMWFGTQYGLDRYDGYKFRVFTPVPGRVNSLSGAYIYALFKDRAGKLWIGCDQFLDRFDPTTETFTHYRIGSDASSRVLVTVVHISQTAPASCGSRQVMACMDSTLIQGKSLTTTSMIPIIPPV